MPSNPALFSDLIFEAIVTEVSYSTGTCTISPLNVNTNSSIDNVPIPVMSGNGNAGLFCPLPVGSRVIAAHTSGRGRTATAIIAPVIKRELLRDEFDTLKPLDVPVGTTSHPEIVDGRITLRGNGGSQVTCFENGDVCINTVGGSGVFLRKNDGKSTYTIVSEDQISFSAAGKAVAGPVRRISGIVRSLFPREEISEVPLYADTKYGVVTDAIGFFPGSIALQRSYNKRRRNPSISEYRVVINEFSTDSQFTGFDDEVDRVRGEIKLFENRDNFQRNRELGNTLHLAEHELIEVIGGNLVDLDGNILDINYRKLSYGGKNNTVPRSQLEINYDRARRISRRGVGYHFQLTTNTRAIDPSESSKNFVFDVDKEGLLKINIPASSNTGNIPFASNAVFVTEDSDEVSVEILNPSAKEPIPVTLRNSVGEIVYPNEESQGIVSRNTGIRYSNSDANPYFPSGNDDLGVSDPIRINPTRYHNMYATAERLIANRIEIISIPFPADDGIVEGSPVLQPFQVPVPPELEEAENGGIPDALAPGSDSVFPSFMGVVAVRPGKPAIYPGGDTLIAGLFYPDNETNAPLSNSFESTQDEGEIGISIVDENGERRKPVGGKSAHITLGGSMEASIGKDNVDGKSLLLDTDGGMVAWFGQDNNQRSMVMQTDGEVLLNVGGTYQDDDPESPTMNKGRFELRVNVIDKGFVGSEFVAGETNDEGGSPGKQSDFIISISDKGIVIAGNKNNAPMIIRNEDNILIESSSDVIIKSGTDVKFVGGDGRTKTLASMGRE